MKFGIQEELLLSLLDTVHIRCNLRGKLVLNAYAILANAYAISANAYAFLANAFERVRYINARARAY